MKTNPKIATLISTAVLLLGGGLFISAQSSFAPKAEQRVAECKGGGYPYYQCEIINGKKVCRRQCPDPMSNG